MYPALGGTIQVSGRDLRPVAPPHPPSPAHAIPPALGWGGMGAGPPSLLLPAPQPPPPTPSPPKPLPSSLLAWWGPSCSLSTPLPSLPSPTQRLFISLGFSADGLGLELEATPA